jgi:transketolase
MRLLRGQVPVVFDPNTYQFEIGKSRLLCEGSDVAIISTGLMTARALKAVVRLNSSGVSAALLHVSTLKPFDTEGVLALLKKIPRVVTAENHFTTGGLASAVADAIVDAEMAVQLKRVGIPNCFCESGSIPYLVRRYQMDSEDIENAALELIHGEGRQR